MKYKFSVNNDKIIKVVVNSQSLNFCISVQLIDSNQAEMFYNRCAGPIGIAIADHGMPVDFSVTVENDQVVFQGNMENVLTILAFHQILPRPIVLQIMQIWKQQKEQLQRMISSTPIHEVVAQLAAPIKHVFTQLSPDQRQMYLTALVQAMQ